MSKLINGRPMSELSEKHGNVLLMHREKGLMLGYAHGGYVEHGECSSSPFSNFSEWAEILKPEPKPDANGWWKMDEKQPKENQCVQVYDLNSSRTYIKDWVQPMAHYTHWKLWEGPCE